MNRLWLCVAIVWAVTLTIAVVLMATGSKLSLNVEHDSASRESEIVAQTEHLTVYVKGDNVYARPEDFSVPSYSKENCQ